MLERVTNHYPIFVLVVILKLPWMFYKADDSILRLKPILMCNKFAAYDLETIYKSLQNMENADK